MRKHPYDGYKPPNEADMEMLHAKVKECVTEAKKILQQKKGVHGYYITPYVSEEIETAFNCLTEAEELFEKDAKFRKVQHNG